VSTARLPSQTSVALTTSSSPLANSNRDNNHSKSASCYIPCRQTSYNLQPICRDSSSSSNRYNNNVVALASHSTRRYKSTAAISPDEEPVMGESLDEGGYLGRILNAKVYDVAVETELQHAKNLSVVSV
jgi:hypothetical protein